MSNRDKSAAETCRRLDEASAAIRNAVGTWAFDVQSYLQGARWRDEVEAIARERHGLRVIRNDAAQQLISSPVAVQALPGQGRLRIGGGRGSWPAIRPSAVAAELKRLRDRASEANSQEFLESLYRACERQERQRGDGRMFITFREAYDLFCLAPGYRKENTRQVFGEMLYTLHRSGIQATRTGKVVQWEWPSARVKETEIFTVLAEDGSTLRYYGIWFR
jgi:hypothetical protein